MNSNDRSNEAPHDGLQVADQNVERLLAQAYEPEKPDAEFIAQVTRRVIREAQREPASGKPVIRLATKVRQRVFRWETVPWTVVVVLLALLVFLPARRSPPPTLDYFREGEIVWIDGQAYKVAESGSPANGSAPATQTRTGYVSPTDFLVRPVNFVDGYGLTPRVRPPSIEKPSIKVGESIMTGRGERRRAELPDGSTLYVNQSTLLTVEDSRMLSLNRGEVYLDVAPQRNATADAKFVVKTPSHTVTALGTKFAAQVDKAETGVLVTQGTVQVSGIKTPVGAGQQVKLSTHTGEAEQQPAITATRASQALDWTRELMAGAESPLVPASDHSGGSLIAVDPDGQEVKLSLRKYHVDVHIEDGFARTTIDQTYFNHKSWRMEGTFYFPLPPDASISRLAMYVNGRLMEGGMCERDHARNVFETIKHRALDPALLEWVDGSTFKMRVFPLEGRQEKRIILSYTQRLPNHYGRTQYRFARGNSKEKIRDRSIRIRLAGDELVEWRCDSHDFQAAKTDGELILASTGNDVSLDRDVVVDLVEKPFTSGDSSRAHFATTQHDNSRYFMVRFRPQLKTKPRSQRRDWVFLFDADGSRDPLVARVQVDVIRSLLKNAEHDDRFAVVTAGTRTRTFAPELQPVTADNIAEAVKMLDRTHLIGALDLERALGVCGDYCKSAENPTLVHVGGAVPILAERRTHVLLKRLPEKAQYVGVAVGKRWNRSFMKSAASGTGGYFTQINPDECVGWRAFDLMATLNRPRLHDLRVQSNDEAIEFLMFNDSAVHGEEICAIARLEPHQELPSTIRIRGRLNGEAFDRTLPADQVEDGAGYLPRQWAKLSIDEMVGENAEKHKTEIIALSKSMYVMSPFTSLLVLENDEMYQQYNVDRGRKDHWALYPCPEKIEVVHEPLVAPSEPVKRGKKESKPSPRTVLSSLLVRSGRYRFTTAMPAGISGVPLTLPRFPFTYVTTTVSVPDGGTVLLGGIRRRVNFGNTGPNVMFGIDPMGLPGADFDLTSSRDVSQTLGATSAANDEFIRRVYLDLAGEIPSSAQLQMDFDNLTWETRGGSDVEFNSLIDLIRTTIAPGTWEDIGGTGSIERFPANLSLVISQKQTVHDQFLPRIHPVGDLLLPASIGDTEWAGFGGRGPSRSVQRAPAEVQDPRLVALWARVLRHRFEQGVETASLLYVTPDVGDDQRQFRNLLAYAPGMNTTLADISSVLEREAELTNPPQPGKIDQEAQRLIDAARSRGWQTVVLRDSAGRELLRLQVDGRGRYRSERKTEHGLRETVICDGESLWHLYPELGLGARRQVSRFHRAELQSLVPWYLPAADDLAMGADLKTVGPRTVAIVPHHPQDAKDESGNPIRNSRVHLVFSDSGRLVQRRLVEMPSGKTIGQVAFDEDGAVRVVDAAGKIQDESRFEVAPSPAPNLQPETGELVILPMPIRTSRNLASATEEAFRYMNGSDEDALRLIAAYHWQDPRELREVIGQRFFANGDRRIGFYMLLFSSGLNWDPSAPVKVREDLSVGLNPLADHPNNPLAHYISSQLKPRGAVTEEISPIVVAPGNRFISQLYEYQRLYTVWRQTRKAAESTAQLRRELDALFEFLDRCDSPAFAFTLLRRLQFQLSSFSPLSAALTDNPQREPDRLDTKQICQRIDEALSRFEEQGVTSYVLQYERARELAVRGNRKEARRRFLQLYWDTFNQGILPPIDRAFVDAVGDLEDPFAAQPPDENEQLEGDINQLMRKACRRLIEQGRRSAAVGLAGQCRDLGLADLAEQLLQQSLSDVSPDQRFSTRLAAVEFLVHDEQYTRADSLMQTLLGNERLAGSAELWRLAAQVADHGKLLARALHYQERAIELELQQFDSTVNLQWIREQFGGLLGRYSTLAELLALPGSKTIDNELVQGVVRTADRWRSLDSDPTAACEAAARALNALGRSDLAWDYLTTPLALRPNEAAPWLELAQSMQEAGQIQMADQAYAAAFEAEPTNAEILWGHARLLDQHGQTARAMQLYSQIAGGQWQPRFDSIRRQAKAIVEK